MLECTSGEGILVSLHDLQVVQLIHACDRVALSTRAESLQHV